MQSRKWQSARSSITKDRYGQIIWNSRNYFNIFNMFFNV